MAEQWEQTFKTFGEKTHSITQIIQNANEGDDLEEPFKVRNHSLLLPIGWNRAMLMCDFVRRRSRQHTTTL